MKLKPWTFGLAIVSSLVLAASGRGADAGAVQLVNDGKAACVIVAPGRACPGVTVATESAVLLASHLKRMSGATVNVMVETELNAEVRDGRVVAMGGRVDERVANFVLVGESELAKKLGVTSEGLGAGGLLVKTTGNALVLLGPPETSDPRGTRYAVVSLLEDLGCRYLWPGESGQVVPHRSTIEVGSVERRYTPRIGQRNIRHQPSGPRYFDKGLSFLGVMNQQQWFDRYYSAMGFREVRSEAAGQQTKAWLPPGPDSIPWEDWQGLNGYALGILGGHAGCGLRGGWAEHGKTHPEWFALQPDGTRDMSKANDRWTLCISNPQLIEYVANDVIARMQQKPEPSISLAPNDGGSACECMCEECRKLDPLDAPKIKLTSADKSLGAVIQIDYPSLSDRYVHYWNAIAERVAKVYPDLPLVIDAYGPYSTPPVREKLHPNLVVRYVPSDLDGWKGWQQAGAKRIFWRPSNLHSHYREATIHAVGYARKIGDTMRVLAANGMLATDIQGIYDNWAVQGLNYYVAARTMWNPSLTFDQILDDYCGHGFGPAAKPIKAYFTKALVTTEEVYGLTGPAGVAKMYEALNLAGMEELKGDLDSAEKLAAGDEAVLKRIAFLRVGLNWSTISTKAALIRWDAQQKKPYDHAEAKRVLDERWRMAREIAMNNILAVNTTLVAGYDDTNWRDLDWHKPESQADDSWMFEDQSQLGAKH